MTRFIDDLETRFETRSPTPEEVNVMLEEARLMRAAALGHAFASIRRTLARVVRLPRRESLGRPTALRHG